MDELDFRTWSCACLEDGAPVLHAMDEAFCAFCGERRDPDVPDQACKVSLGSLKVAGILPPLGAAEEFWAACTSVVELPSFAACVAWLRDPLTRPDLSAWGDEGGPVVRRIESICGNGTIRSKAVVEAEPPESLFRLVLSQLDGTDEFVIRMQDVAPWDWIIGADLLQMFIALAQTLPADSMIELRDGRKMPVRRWLILAHQA